MKILVVGDLHVVPEELADCDSLLGHVLSVAAQEDVKEVWFTGDQHHTHAVLRLEVLHWWKNAFTALHKAGLKAVALVGNHDQMSPGSHINAMMAYDQKLVTVIDRPTVRHGVLMVPYVHTQEEFTQAVKTEATKIVFCHQTFNGATYENGFLASDGFDLNLVPQDTIISGHIHASQEFGKVWYVGSPRWRSLSDANQDRAIWLLNIEEGHMTSRTPYDTSGVCRMIKHVLDTEDSPVALPLDLRHQWRVDIKGSEGWCQKRKVELSAAGARVRVFRDAVSTEGKVRESEGVDAAFKSFLSAFQPKYGTPTATLEALAKERL